MTNPGQLAGPDLYWRVVFRRRLDTLRDAPPAGRLLAYYLMSYRIGQLIAGGVAPQDPVLDFLVGAGEILAHLDPPLDPAKVDQVMRDGLTDGGQLPDEGWPSS